MIKGEKHLSYFCIPDGSICWVARGAQLEVLDLGTLNRRASWQFGRILGDEHTTITCVEEMFLKNDSSTKLIVGISNSSPNGLICVFDVNTQRIEKSIEIRFPVSILCELHSGKRGLNVSL